jgi:hypothetical protein
VVASTSTQAHLAFTGAPVGAEALLSGMLLVAGVVLCRLAQRRWLPRRTNVDPRALDDRRRG